jgi:hypothetical protein
LIEAHELGFRWGERNAIECKTRRLGRSGVQSLPKAI